MFQSRYWGFENDTKMISDAMNWYAKRERRWVTDGSFIDFIILSRDDDERMDETR